MNKKIFILLIMILSYISLGFTKPVLYSINSDYIHFGNYGDSSVQFVTTDDNLQISLTGEFSSDEDYVKYIVNIQNKGNETYHFDENNILAYEGNYESNSWYSLPYRSAQSFYEDKKSDLIFASVIMGAITLGALAVSDFDIDIVNIAHPLSFFVPPIPLVVVKHDPVLDGLALANLFYFMELDDDLDSLEYLEKVLLFSTDIRPNEEYTGVIFVPKGKGPDYKIIFNVSPNETYNFAFARSDRENIITKDEKKQELSVSIMGGFNLPYFETWSFYTFIKGNIIGGYFGASLGLEGTGFTKTLGTVGNNNFNNVKITNENYKPKNSSSSNYDYRFINPTNRKNDSFSFSAGLTTTIISNLYIMYGCGLEISRDIYYGTFQWKKSNEYESQFKKLAEGWIDGGFSFYPVPQFGLIGNIGHFTGGVVFDFVVGKGPRFNTIFGYEF